MLWGAFWLPVVLVTVLQQQAQTLTDTQTGKAIKSEGKVTELLESALELPTDSPARLLAETLIAQQETALMELGLELGSQYQLSHAEQAQLATETANNAVSDQSMGELFRLMGTNANKFYPSENIPKVFLNKNNYDTIRKEGSESLAQERGQNMPYYAEAVTPAEKFVNYSLNYSNKNAAGKAEAYERGLGYTQENADGLIKQIHDAVTSGKTVPFQTSSSKYGTKYKYRIAVTGPNGKTKNVIAVYQIDTGSKIPRLITNYLEGK